MKRISNAQLDKETFAKIFTPDLQSDPNSTNIKDFAEYLNRNAVITSLLD